MFHDKRTIYHSHLVQAGTVEALITGEPQKSKFKKEGKDSYWVGVKIDGSEHQLTIENDVVKEKLTGLRNHMVQLTATGSRDEADIDVYDAAGPMKAPPQQPPPSQGQGQRQSAPPSASKPSARTDKENILFAKRCALQAANAYLIALRAARYVRDQSFAESNVPMSDSHFQACTASLFIQLDRTGGLIQSLPAHPMEKPAAPPPREPEPPPPPRRQEPPPQDPPYIDGDDDAGDIPF
jgi:hypothetical protein